MNIEFTYPLRAKVLYNIMLISIMLLSYSALGQTAQPVAAKEAKLVIAVTFTVPLENREAFKSKITDLFKIIKKEEKAFVSYAVSEDINNPGTILLYENWNTNLKDFGQGPAGKSYFAPFLQALSDLGISREAHLYTPF